MDTPCIPRFAWAISRNWRGGLLPLLFAKWIFLIGKQQKKRGLLHPPPLQIGEKYFLKQHPYLHPLALFTRCIYQGPHHDHYKTGFRDRLKIKRNFPNSTYNRISTDNRKLRVFSQNTGALYLKIFLDPIKNLRGPHSLKPRISRPCFLNFFTLLCPYCLRCAGEFAWPLGTHFRTYTQLAASVIGYCNTIW